MSEQNRVSMDDSEYQVYLDERKALIDAEREGARLFDKAILTLTAGAFGLSLAFIKQIVTVIKCGTLLWLIIGWAGFSLSLLSTLTSFLTSQSACRRQLKILESVYRDKSESREEKNRPANWTSWLNISSIAFFILGMIFLTIFVIKNL